MPEMKEQIKLVAQRIRALREVEGLTAEEMAVKTGVSVEQYLKYESGEVDYSFTFVYKMARACGVGITDILEGESANLSSYAITRHGGGMPIARETGFKYFNLAPLFKNKLAEPFFVKVPYEPEALDQPMPLVTHKGQEFNIILKGRLKYQLGESIEYLGEGDTIYHDGETPHGMVALDGPAELYAVVLNPGEGDNSEMKQVFMQPSPIEKRSVLSQPVADSFLHTETDENGVLTKIEFTEEAENFNFAYDVVDALALKSPNKLAMVHLTKHKTERRFTFAEMSRYSNMAANYFKSLGIKKGDRVMLVLKRHYQFWFAILGLHKIGAVVIPATNQLVAHDFDYRFKAGEVSAIVCTGDGNGVTAAAVEEAAKNNPQLVTKVLVNGKREGWHDFNTEFQQMSDEFARPKGNDPMLMFFTSGTSGYPKMAVHSFKYALGHYTTARYWHNVNPDGLHFTIAETGWGKALWGKLYGQWLAEAAVFTYDFDRFDSADILPLFAKYNITTFCAPPTMYRFFIKEDLSKYDLSSLEYCTVAGEALNAEVFQQFYKATGLSIHEGFGQTETTLSIANFVGVPLKPGSMGKASPLYDVHIMNADGTLAKDGETGEIVIRTEEEAPAGLFIGYYNNPEKTKEAWHDGFYHTGDTAWRDEDGYFWYVGRVDDLIKSSGYRIGPFEIESVIMELPYVLECAVTAAPDEIRGQVVKATIVLTKGTEGSDALKKEIQNYVKTNTAPYKYPRIVEFVESLPKTISGKIRRVEIRGENK